MGKQRRWWGIICSALLGGSASAAAWSPLQRISFDFGGPASPGAGGPMVVVSPISGIAYCTYTNTWNRNNTNEIIIALARGIRNGRTLDWSATRDNPIDVCPRQFKNLAARIAVGSKNGQEILHVVYRQGSLAGTDAMYVRSTDGGFTWTAPFNVSNTTTGTEPDVAADDQGNVYVVYLDWVGRPDENGRDIWFRKFNGAGNSWEPNKRIEDNPATKSQSVRINRNVSGKLQVGWCDRGITPQQVSYSVSADNGATFSPAERVMFVPDGHDSDAMAICEASDGTVFFAMRTRDTVNFIGADLYLSTKPPGQIWSPRQAIAGSNPAANPYLTGDAFGRIFLSWLHDTGNAPWDIYVYRRTTYSAWSSLGNATNDGLWKGYTGGEIGVDGPNNLLHTVTDDTPGGRHQIYASTLDLTDSLPAVDFYTGPFPTSPPYTVAFHDFSNSPNITSRSWSFGDQSSGTGTDPTHLFATWGTYNVKLTIIANGSPLAVTHPVLLPGPPGTITGTVHNQFNQPLAGAALSAANTSFTATSNAGGNYVFILPSGTYTLTASHSPNLPQTQTVTVTPGQTITLDFTLIDPNIHVGDFDHDGDVDQSDFGRFQLCLTGSAVPQNDPNCVDAMLDDDNDVDQNDLAIWRGCMSGAGFLANPHCAD